MHRIKLLLKIIIVIVFALFFSIIGVNKKTIDSINDKKELEKNIDTLRGVMWANYTFITVSLSIALTLIVVRKYYQEYKWTVIFGIVFGLLNTFLVALEEMLIKDNNVDESKLNSIYAITIIMNIIYFILFVRLINITNGIIDDSETYTSEEVEEHIRSGPYQRPYYSPSTPSEFEGAYGNVYGQNRYSNKMYKDMYLNPKRSGSGLGSGLGSGSGLTADDVEYDPDYGLIIKRRNASF